MSEEEGRGMSDDRFGEKVERILLRAQDDVDAAVADRDEALAMLHRLRAENKRLRDR